MPFMPKKIHFIWVGGPIKKEYMENIENLALLARQSGFEINVWVDKESNYKRKDIANPNLRIRNIAELKPRMATDAYYTESPGKAKLFAECLAREFIGKKNLAAASDLLRCEILRQEGGYYIDTDTQFYLGKKDRLTPDFTKSVKPSKKWTLQEL